MCGFSARLASKAQGGAWQSYHITRACSPYGGQHLESLLVFAHLNRFELGWANLFELFAGSVHGRLHIEPWNVARGHPILGLVSPIGSSIAGGCSVSTGGGVLGSRRLRDGS